MSSDKVRPLARVCPYCHAPAQRIAKCGCRELHCENCIDEHCNAPGDICWNMLAKVVHGEAAIYPCREQTPISMRSISGSR
jgi:hypothetical protein